MSNIIATLVPKKFLGVRYAYVAKDICPKCDNECEKEQWRSIS